MLPEQPQSWFSSLFSIADLFVFFLFSFLFFTGLSFSWSLNGEVARRISILWIHSLPGTTVRFTFPTQSLPSLKFFSLRFSCMMSSMSWMAQPRKVVHERILYPPSYIPQHLPHCINAPTFIQLLRSKTQKSHLICYQSSCYRFFLQNVSGIWSHPVILIPVTLLQVTKISQLSHCSTCFQFWFSKNLFCTWDPDCSSQKLNQAMFLHY